MSATDADSTTSNGPTAEQKREYERYQHCHNKTLDEAETIQRPCESCDDGWLWRLDSELVCDTCHQTMLRTPGDSVTLDQYESRRQSRNESVDEYDEYKSGYVRLIGGYKSAYLATGNGREYTLNTYGEIGDGLWTPHKRDR